ncbi:zinc-dependent alcohol dehydrogenase family protein [Paraburkholderia nemoris]|jgi:alcohol dehydrogenase, propanol-preferring|uniref:zinc-dependent alcohol dehydrogenase family protein n=1 Tax=Paraburkholderia nemoris TaxID=2793076 RepID=UPI0006B55A51|nr:MULTISPECIES: zinc-dependent alcohol dehydrogenase family protein [Paraburkholderia]KPD17494.1 alcohol dehydrogenase [Burkholderia sp. ST111]MBK5146063.1 zinc-dependent alcohol dehydrogenase family protein [Burkholderia sp. R-69608]MBK3738986.1 zinc-dependent alcohol dehydrogenase family protein [Paraburkholderia aspalathi]MBK3781637.1 zinc-dependent alcohol dehydrogenase family protein [Paraburkholderia aspalathi]CAE6689349.1 putative alcohol dehydrogenase AdhA [Paraburkholderia nemoris]
MRAMVFDDTGGPLRDMLLPDPVPAAGQLLIDVHACGICRTDLHLIDHELPHPKRPVIPGHEIVGTVAAVGPGVSGFSVGERVGVPWVGHTCGHCRYCLSGRENLCDEPGFTGYTIDGGYAELTLADSRYCFHLPDRYSDVEAAPLLCAGLIGYRTLAMAGDAQRIGIYGFGAAAHIVAQVALHQGRTVYAFTRDGDVAAQQLALRLGATWAGSSNEAAPDELDAALLFAPVGALVPIALKAVAKGGIVVCGGIHMSDIPSFPYDFLWGERRVVSVANLTREDGLVFMRLAAEIPLDIETTRYPLGEANQALADLREGKLTGAAVLAIR